MKVHKLLPALKHKFQFAWSEHLSIPAEPGCYVIATYFDDVLYVGLASTSIRSRFTSHLETPEKRNGAPQGVPFWFYFVRAEASAVGQIERGWMNQTILEDGHIPHLNKIISPV